MFELGAVVLGTAVAGNLLLEGLFGLSGACATTRSYAAALGMAAASGAVIVAVVPLVAAFQALVLAPLGLPELTVPAAMLAALAVARAGLAAARRACPAIALRLAPYASLAVFNSAVLGAVVTLGADAGAGVTLARALGAGTGFALAVILLGAVRERLASTAVPAAFRGLPIALVTLGLTALGLFGLRGG